MGGAKKPVLPRKFGDGSEFGLSYDYRALFTDAIYKGYFSNLQTRAAAARGKKEREALSGEMRAAAALYATAIYYIYPRSQGLREAIDSDDELARNFSEARKLADENNYKQAADMFVEFVGMGLAGNW